MKTVRLPSGEQIEFPDDATDAEIDSIVNGIQSAPPQKSSTMGKVARPFVQSIPSVALGIPGLVGDAYMGLVSAQNTALNAAVPRLGLKVPPPFPFANALSEGGKQLADSVGLPRPETRTEEGIDSVATTLLSTVGGAGLAKMLASGVPKAIGILSSDIANAPRISNITRGALDDLASAPVLQGAGAVGGGVATDVAKDLELGPSGTMALGLIGSVAGGGGAEAIARSGAASKALIDPLREAGREVIVGRTLREVATSPDMAAERLASAPRLIENSDPTVAQASRDPGLMAAEAAARNTFEQRNKLGQRASDQNAARVAELDDLAGNAETLARAKAYKAKVFEEEATPAFASVTPIMQGKVKLGRDWANNPVLRVIRDVRDNPLDAGVKNIETALNTAEKFILEHPSDIADPRALYAARRNVNDFMQAESEAAKKAGDGGRAAAAMKLKPVVAKMDELIETGAPGYRRYMELYAKAAKDVERIETLQRVRTASMAGRDPALPTAADEGTMGSLTLKGGFGASIRKQADELRATLSPDQFSRLMAIAEDFDRGLATTSTSVRTGNSTTMRNMSMANVMGRIMGDRLKPGAGQAVSDAGSSAFGFMYHVPDKIMQDMLIEAFLDPKLAAKWMRKAADHEVEALGKQLEGIARRNLAAQMAYGGQ